eukprot:gene9741-11447_t
MATLPCPYEIHILVGGYHYYLNTDDLLDYPDSYFSHFLKDEWIKNKTAILTLDRDGKSFCYVYSYMLTGHIDPVRNPISDLTLLATLRTEADFYGLPKLANLCDDRHKNHINRIIYIEQDMGLRCDCVQASEQKSTDALVTAMQIFRPPTIATSRLETYQSDSFESYYQDASDFLKCAREGSHGGWARRCCFAHNCTQVNEYGFSNATNGNMYIAFSKWPLTTEEDHVNVFLDHAQVWVYEKEGYCSSRMPVHVKNRNYHGTFLYIFNSEHTGGRITTKVNGEEVSIEKPGECMALLPGCSYSVETVTSGHLVLFEFAVSLERDPATGVYHYVTRNVEGNEYVESPLAWQVRDSYSTEITAERSAALTQAINTALETYAGVVICLSTYYPTGHSTNKNRRCETDPALLKKFDAEQHAHLSRSYEVLTVTVAVEVDDANMNSTARVLDFPSVADMKLKIVAPMQTASLDRVSSKRMLLTGLVCFARG